MNASVTAHVSSKDRYFTTLPSCILSVTQQTIKPQRLIVFMDGEHIDLRENDLYAGLFNILSLQGIEWEVLFAPGKGQVPNHQKALEMSKTEWVWRLDDDTFAQPDVLEQLLSCDGPKVGAVAGLVINPKQVSSVPFHVTGTLDDVVNSVNIQWYTHDSPKIIEVEHLYSTFLFKKSAGSHGYCDELSPVGHREETIFTYEMHRKGWKLLVNPKAVTWHVRQGQGGIRTYQSAELWEHDEAIFQSKIKKWGVNLDDKLKSFEKISKLIILDNGKGDHIMFKFILPEIKEKYKDKEIIIGVCYPDIFEDENGIKLISIAEAHDLCGRLGRDFDKFNIYRFCIENNWKTQLTEAFRKIYLE